MLDEAIYRFTVCEVTMKTVLNFSMVKKKLIKKKKSDKWAGVTGSPSYNRPHWAGFGGKLH